MLIQLDVIEIRWDGPYSFKEAKEKLGPTDYGIYQIYGTHAITGPHTLLYIGQSCNRRFGKRLAEQEQSNMFFWVPGELSIYLGRLGSKPPIKDPLSQQWANEIDRAERLLIYQCTPAYNSAGLNWPREMPPTLLLNHWRRYRLPFAVTSLAATSQALTPGWDVYGTEPTA